LIGIFKINLIKRLSSMI